MRYRNLLWASAIAIIATGCKDEIQVNPPAEPGTDVQFTALSTPSTRTVYGAESENGIAVNWKNGDKVWVASPQCGGTCQYTIETTNGADLNYADKMNKVGEIGLRWGTETEGYNFYSIYPADGNTIANNGQNCTASLNISQRQFCGVTSLQQDGSELTVNLLPNMSNAVMYAATKGVSSTAGGSVALRYEPYSTVLDLTIQGPSNATGVADEVTIQNIILTAPSGTNISGNFEFDLTNANTQENTPVAPKVTAGEGSNSISLSPVLWADAASQQGGTYITLDKQKYTAARVKFMLIPREGLTIDENWTITVETSGGTFTKTLAGIQNGALTPGAIHKMTLPHLDLNSQWNYKADSWITSLPDYKNIYLSEITLPGAWYGTQSEYQGTNVTYQSLINAGVRAIGLETRSYTPRTGFVGAGDLTNDVPTKVVISGGGSEKDGAYTHQWLKENLIVDLTTALQDIARYVPENEFAVVVISYADGGSGGHRALDYGYWLQGVYNAYNSMTSYKDKIYTGPLNKTTTVNDVLGKLIIKVNVDKRITQSYTSSDVTHSYGKNIPGLLSYTDLNWTSSTAASSLISQMSYKDFPSLENLTGGINSLGSAGFYWNYTVANRTKTSGNPGTGTDALPSYTNRKNSILSIVGDSEAVYKSGNHNVWFYVGAGGTEAENTTTSTTSTIEFAKNMNSWLLRVLNAKLNGTALPDAQSNPGTGTNLRPSPLGMVMCNYITDSTYRGLEIIDAIIRINSKFVLAHKPTQTQELRSVVSTHSSGFKKNANGWDAFE